MTDQNTKILSRPQGGMGFFESLEDIYRNSFELAARGQGDFVNEGPVRQMPEHNIGSAFADGTIANFQNSRGIEDAYSRSGDKRVDPTTAEQLKFRRTYIPNAPVEETRVKVNDLLGFQAGYEVPVDNQGQFTGKYYEVQAELAEAELIDQQQRDADRADALQMATGKKTSIKGVVSGADELQTRIYGADIKRTFEDHNMQGPG